MLFALYIRKNDKWLKIGELCEGCGFHLDRKILEEIGLTEKALTVNFDGPLTAIKQ